MRPLLQGLSTFREHVYLRNNTYYYRSDVPSDLAHYFPTSEVKRSLKTSDPNIAKLAANAGDRKTVVVTHHGVSPLSIHEKFRGDSLNCAFMTDISIEIIDHGPDLWVHGHTHNTFDYTLGKTRVVANLYGYKDVEVNPQYDRQLVIEI